MKYYKSTMMLGEISQTPRKDSMGMEMVPVYEGEGDSGAISIDPVTMQNMGLRTAVVTKGPVRRIIRTVGVIDFNETALSEVTTKFKGWIEKLYVDSTGKQVHKGEPLFEIYSPDLYAAQNEYILASDSRAGARRQSALTKLKYYDISAEQIAELEKSRQAKKTLSVSAPRDGIVVEKMAVEGQMVERGHEALSRRGPRHRLGAGAGLSSRTWVSSNSARKPSSASRICRIGSSAGA